MILSPSHGQKAFDPNSSITYCVGAGEQSVCPGAGSPCYGGSNSGVAPGIGLYPRMHLMPSGLVITCGEEVTVRSWDPCNRCLEYFNPDFIVQEIMGLAFLFRLTILLLKGAKS